MFLLFFLSCFFKYGKLGFFKLVNVEKKRTKSLKLLSKLTLTENEKIKTKKKKNQIEKTTIPFLSLEFYKNHKQTTFTVIDEIITHFKNKQKLIAVLSEMIAESYNSLLGEPAKDDSKNIEWETVELNPVENNK